MYKLIQMEDRKQLKSQLYWFLTWLIITAFAIYLNPDPHQHGTHRQLGLPPCPSVLLLDRPCPGCGLTTAFAHIVRGQLIPAFNANAFGPILYLALTASAIPCGWFWFKKVRFDTNTKKMNWSLGSLTVGFALYGVIRFSMVELHDPISVKAFHPTARKESGQPARMPEQSSTANLAPRS
jgi:hypothetical protein